ncbi:putative polyadenylate-binding protein 1 [Encephalitozoon romaleae SJ-2008]|uniref:Polyadenylate-binding protein 1 n=1 Tax=Encephalitozoon romaleae (strain SJ-2008) TaxID=1178016 RepID=I6ZJ74_ENCRO|nr:putative polyadenylate-binding protein 1 [Encephalitozoon romaleae SJ-2008]AFN83278.1 putative polyadenylate-binding protein 1 [Encephalitozoon romaleae SJ-2008]
MIVVNDEDLKKTIEEVANAKRNELKNLDAVYKSVIEYGKWVIPKEGIKSVKFDSTLLNKVYIGNITASKGSIKDLLSVFGPVSVTYISGKECAFADFDNPHAAYLCMEEINGMAHDGKILKAGRTSTFPSEIPKDLGPPDETIVYVSNIDLDIEEEQLKDVFGKMGEIKDVRLVYEESFVHKGYGYVQFSRPGDARRALGYSNKISLYGKRIRIGPSVIKMDLPKRSHFAVPEQVFEIKKRIENVIFGKGKMVVLRNLIDIDDADDDFDQEIENEMRKYGNVERFGISKEGEVVVYCLYSTEDEAKHSFNILNGRFFGGRRIRAEMSCGDFSM